MPRFTWSETAIADALRPIVAELGRQPTRVELRERGLSNLWDAMRRRGTGRLSPPMPTRRAPPAYDRRGEPRAS